MNLTRAFASYGAVLQNTRWAVSALSGDGAVVLSCWQQYFTIPETGVLRYQDSLSRWSTDNPSGSRLCGEHLQAAFDGPLPVRLVIATTEDERAVDAGNASNAGAAFHVKKTHVGRVTQFDGDAFVIDFRREED